MQKLFIGLIKGYQLLISPMLGKRCRFYPTCSEYAIESIKVHGVLKGGYLTCKRLIKCHPFGKSGHDPVPLKNKSACCDKKSISITNK